MRIDQIVWDLDDDPDGYVQHIAEHDLTIEEVEEVLRAAQDVVASHASGRPMVFGETSTRRYIAVVFDIVDRNPLIIYPVTAYEPQS